MNGKSCSTPLDSQLLIAAVFARPPLWDRNNLLHKNNEFVESLWKEVSTELESPKEVLKSRWKGLKDTFRKESKKRGTKKSKWIHFKKLSFLEDSECNKSMNEVGKSSDEETSEEVQDLSVCGMEREEEDNDKIIKSVPDRHDSKEGVDRKDLLTEVTAMETQTSFASVGIQDTALSDSALSASEQVESEPRRSFIWPNSDQFQRIDDDYHFFMSLVPHFKQLTPDQKLVLRIKMQEIVYKEMFGSLPD
ncbi:uncharacterized protein LOC111044593 [Nilaparvata lugens]|uniref:uncharacterized protein LOC111044593 n=1 Tax=Nilaparvata lugens TaxID=108931 RepID=UPI000B984CB1|nr:uncharacterized protein LOC111044593 [Nilaparvata lugens]